MEGSGVEGTREGRVWVERVLVGRVWVEEAWVEGAWVEGTGVGRVWVEGTRVEVASEAFPSVQRPASGWSAAELCQDVAVVKAASLKSSIF